MQYEIQENCLTIFLPPEVDHHSAEEIKRGIPCRLVRIEVL